MSGIFYMFVKNNDMEELDKIVDDYIEDCFRRDNDKPFTRESIQAWWQSNKEMYNSEIVEIIRYEVGKRILRMIREEEKNKDLSKN